MNAKRLKSGNIRAKAYDYTDEEGKKHYRSFTAKTKAEAERIANEWKLSQKKQISPRPLTSSLGIMPSGLFESSILPIERIKRIVDSGFDGISWDVFEDLCASVLAMDGFICKSTPKRGDHGADIIASKGPVIFSVQCKYLNSHVGFDAIKEVYTSKGIYGTDKALVITNNDFTKQAILDAAVLGVSIWNGSVLAKLFYGLIRG